MDNNTWIALELKNIREKLGLTQREFSIIFDIPLATYIKWEQEKTKCPRYVLSMISRIIWIEEDRCRLMNIECDWKVLANALT